MTAGIGDRTVKVLVSVGLAAGAVFGMAGTFAPSAALRGILWGIDGAGLIMATALLALAFFRQGHDLAAAGYLIFCVGESLLVAGLALDLAASTASFGGGIALWALGLALISGPRVWPPVVRFLGILAAVLFGVTALRIFGGAPITPLTAPFPFFAYPALVATLIGWLISLWSTRTRPA